MSTIRRYAILLLAALALFGTWGSSATAGDPAYDLSVYREYRAAKRQQVGYLCEIWFATWRPDAVGKTYHSLAGRYAQMEAQLDDSRCSSSLRSLIIKAESTSSAIAELFGQSTMPDIELVLEAAKGGVGLKSSSSATSLRGRRVLELMDELKASEEDVLRELGLSN